MLLKIGSHAILNMPPLALLAFLALLGPRGPNVVVSAQLCKELEEEGNLLLDETDLATIKASLVRILRRDRDKQGTFLRLAFHDCASKTIKLVCY